MQTNETDPIVAEVRAIRQAYAARFDYDVEAIFRDIRARQEASGRNSYPSNRSTAMPAPMMATVCRSIAR